MHLPCKIDLPAIQEDPNLYSRVLYRPSYVPPLSRCLSPCLYVYDFAMSPEVDADAGETQSGLYHGIQCAYECPEVFTMLYDVLLITSKLWESVRPA